MLVVEGGGSGGGGSGGGVGKIGKKLCRREIISLWSSGNGSGVSEKYWLELSASLTVRFY